MDVDQETIRLGYLGGKMSTRRISSAQAETIFRELSSGVLQTVQISPGTGLHNAEIWIEINGVPKAGFLADNPPQVLEDLLQAVGKLFAAEFGSRFDYVAEHFP